ncbi:hypothetical protein BDZ88DRAFT_453233 [Geranomyces variabilis]|nr:hypothetical protein BDZ88DRAFT_453233 [Geranomyces variabilis]KAJ3133601.1 hypothetical protein HDU90_005679 [Geranomyces variabilis]
MTVADDQIAAISKLRDKTHDLLRSVTHAKRSYVLPPPLPRQHNAQHEPAARPTVPPLKTSRHPSSRQKLPSPTDGIIADSVQPRPTRPRSRTSSPQKAPNRGTTGRPISPLPLTLPSTRPPLHSGAREFRNNRKADAGGPGCRSPSPTQQREAFDRRAREAEQVLFTRDDEWIERLEDFRRVFPDWFHATDPDDRIRYQVDAAMHRAADQAAAVDLDAEDLDALPRSDQAQDVLEDERFYYGGVFRVNERLFPEHVRPALPFANTSDERTGHRWELGLDERPVKCSQHSDVSDSRN